MLKRIVLVCVCLLLPHGALAGTIVTWVGEGQVTRNYQYFPSQPTPPIGTPLSLTMAFEPSSATPTVGAPPGSSGCMTLTGVSAALQIGGYTYAGTNNMAFTHAALPGSNCTVNFDFTQFSLHKLNSQPGNPWNLGDGGVLILSYLDLIWRDGFPNEPTPMGGTAALWYDGDPMGPRWGFSGSLDLRALEEQPTPVPEPGTMVLLATGLAAAWRARRRQAN